MCKHLHKYLHTTYLLAHVLVHVLVHLHTCALACLREYLIICALAYLHTFTSTFVQVFAHFNTFAQHWTFVL